MAKSKPTNVIPMRLIPADECDDRPEIEITHELSDVTDKAVDVLADDPEIYQRGGTLVHVVTPSPTSPGSSSAPQIRELPLPTLRVRLAQCARWIKINRKGDATRVPVPDTITNAVYSRGQWDGVRPLVGVLSSPTMRPDGSVLQVAGYDEPTALLYMPSGEFFEVQDHPSREDAIGAAEQILDLVVDFPFATPSDKTAWLASLLTLVGRHAIEGPCPLFAITANTRGSGKSRLADVASMAAHGVKAARSSLSNVDEEMRKQITSILAEGSTAALIDNVRSGARLGGQAFDALLTSDVWKDRLLGRTLNLTLPARTVWFATGNNISFSGDLPRRTLHIRLESPLENPENREGFKHGEGDQLMRHVESRRKFLVTQALIILRAHAAADRPTCGAHWGSFESWCRVIASAIRWIGLPDPLACRATEDESADEDRSHAAAIMAALVSMDHPVTARELVADLYPRTQYDGEPVMDPFPTYAAAREALEVATAAKGTPNALQAGNFLRRIQGRVIDGKAIVGKLDPHTKVQRWIVRSSEAPT